MGGGVAAGDDLLHRPAMTIGKGQIFGRAPENGLHRFATALVIRVLDLRRGELSGCGMLNGDAEVENLEVFQNLEKVRWLLVWSDRASEDARCSDGGGSQEFSTVRSRFFIG